MTREKQLEIAKIIQEVALILYLSFGVYMFLMGTMGLYSVLVFLLIGVCTSLVASKIIFKGEKK